MPLTPQIPATSSQKPPESGTGRALYALLLCTGLAGSLAFAITSWLRLRPLQPGIAYALLFYALLLTALHMPLTMNTRLRSPLFDPLLAALAGGGRLSVAQRLSGLVAPPSPKR